ncbi:hypothetical protein MF672_032020 [Actinomadura sp. ATCC 31491]|uniref:DUF4177 domain-containing protein n=1 Tax=Actinomadura luzonensis TaxID=2805427 RepID=A0ABT0G199_9ACTN|nr:hypothetical protein [Actinomadura luzonensis]MCK2218387.1 hypothetical protein [Actinomadura luzonensis]
MWEYKLRRLGGKVTRSKLQRQFDELGAQGWEFAGFTPMVELQDETVEFDRHAPGCLMVFKRAVPAGG